MKAILFLLITASSFSAHAILESFYGRVTSRGSVHHCTYRNTTHSTLDMKYVAFDVELSTGDSMGHTEQKRIDRFVAPGERITASMDIPLHYIVRHCRFLAR